MSLYIKLPLVFALIACLLTGCWDIKGIQDLNYLASMGFDYKDNEYIVYSQMIDFSTVAKIETGKPTQPVPVWVGIAKGKTVISAINNLYQTTQMRLFFGQVNSIVVGENILRRGVEDVREAVGRYYELRYTPWLFATKEPIDKLFAITPFFNLSPLMSLLHQPVENYKQRSIILPITVRDFASNYMEPNKAILLPSLALADGDWKEGEKPKSLLELDGVFVYQDREYKGWLEKNDVLGLRWMEPKMNRSPALIQSDGKPLATLSLEQPKVAIIPSYEEGKMLYDVKVKLRGNVSEVIQQVSEEELEQKAAQLVKHQIKRTFEEGLKLTADVLGFEHVLYRKNNKLWSMLRDQDRLDLHPSSLRNITITVDLDHSGKLKL
ncbi:Spore germination protein B3 precursor [Paenibacillus konkukensis]|uniref:Spore germination protein B3 n=1 Tax=Paenibacillus konkukensis TaxID=2020716 RepID=A0ABY4RLA1_9BACL|nr:Ger(x)C family spore germination protein [Paenibacillus konkukensis]UQZ82661.1 Spore germination protein B3 precursor [Paenibacillus konkukensis]